MSDVQTVEIDGDRFLAVYYPITKAQQCADCNAIFEEAEPEPLYECGNCGTIFNRADSPNGNHQCPDCNKFAAKLNDVSCPECSQGSEIEEVDAVELDSGLVTVEEAEQELG